MNKQLLESLSRIHKHLNNRPIGVITAFSDTYAKKENLKRNANLIRLIRSAGFGFFRLKGRFIEGFGTPEATEVDEISFFVIGNERDSGNLKGFLKIWGRQFHQDSILYKDPTSEDAFLIGTSAVDEEGKPVQPGLGVVEKLGKWHPSKIGEFYSVLKGKTFTFESIVREPRSNFGRWAQKLLGGLE